MQLTYHVTKACNLRCHYCYYADFAAPRLPLDIALRGTDQVLHLGHPHLGVTFFGGEPLLAKDLIRRLLPEVERRAAARGVSVNFKVPTNGTHLDEEFLSFAEAHALFVSLSIDGDEPAHASRVGADGGSSFPEARRALELLVARATSFATYSVVTPANVARLARSVEFLYEAGSRILIVALDHGAPWTRRDLDALGRGYRRLGDFYVRETIRRRRFYLSPFDAKILAHTRPDPGDDTVCRIGVNQLSLAPDGAWFPCIQFVERPELAVGHVATGIDLARCRALHRESAGADPACGSCGIAERCGHHCACLSLQATGTLSGVPPVLCEHERLLTPIADAVARRLFRRRAPLFVQKHYNPHYDLLTALEDVVLERSESR